VRTKNDIGEMTTRKRGAWQKITRMNRWLSLRIGKHSISASLFVEFIRL